MYAHHITSAFIQAEQQENENMERGDASYLSCFRFWPALCASLSMFMATADPEGAAAAILSYGPLYLTHANDET